MCLPENHKEDCQTEIKHVNVKLSSLIIIKVSKYIVIYIHTLLCSVKPFIRPLYACKQKNSLMSTPAFEQNQHMNDTDMHIEKN